MVYNPSVTNQFNLSTSASNASNGFDFSQFDAGNTFISCSTATNEILPFYVGDSSPSGTGIAAITDVTSTTITVTLPNGIRQPDSNLITYNFSIISGSSSGPTEFVSSSLLPVSHSRAQVASIGADNVIDFTSDWTINSDGELGGTELELFDSLTGGSNIFVSSSTVSEYRYNQLNQIPTPIFDITQSYNETFPSILGPVTKIHNSQDEFYDGEFSGSVILVSNGELNEECADFKEINPFLADYKVRTYFDTTSGVTEGKFLESNNLPIDGYIQLFYGGEPGTPLAPVMPDTNRI
jgi:hypothetical protein